jgi:hypothetical protein
MTLSGQGEACELLWSRLWSSALRFSSAPRSGPAVLVSGNFILPAGLFSIGDVEYGKTSVRTEI